jgi:putative protease
MKKPELMSPIKDWASLEACKNYADAVYFAASGLSMRQRSNNITLNDLNKFVDKCHGYKIKAYLTVNSVIYNNDIKIAERIIKRAKEAKVDALIVWDPAVIDLANKYKIKFFVSTQANVSNWMAANFYKKLGASRIVLAREMTLKQIKETKKKTKIGLEVFIHGALCYSISGRCLLSSFLYGKSANCGMCYQPCREEWTLINKDGKKVIAEGRYLLSAKDICMIEYIPQLIKLGIDSFKIEGRRRDAKYIEVTSRCYRQAIDSFFDKTFTKEKVESWKKELSGVYNRGFSTGFYFGVPSKEGITYDYSGNVSKSKKIRIGEVVHFWPKVGVASIKLRDRGIKVGEKIIIEGAKTFIEQEVKSIQIDGKDIKKAKKGDSIGIKIKSIARKGDNIFIIKK